MKSLQYKKFDAFTSGASSGNPAACIYLDAVQSLSDSEMQRIAAEQKGFVSEVVFCTPKDGSTFSLRYFSSEREVAFCGHGTIACMYDLMKNSGALSMLPEIFIDTPMGRLAVRNCIQTLDAVFITAPEPEFHKTDVDAAIAAQALGISPDAIFRQYPIMLVNAGLNTLIVPIATLQAELSIWPDEQALKAFCCDHGTDIVLVFTTDVVNQNNFIRTRVFAPRFGYLEDKATGSGNSALGYYMLRHSMWDGNPILIEQNAEPSAYNIVRLITANGKVLFGGSATVRIEGKYLY